MSWIAASYHTSKHVNRGKRGIDRDSVSIFTVRDMSILLDKHQSCCGSLPFPMISSSSRVCFIMASKTIGQIYPMTESMLCRLLQSGQYISKHLMELDQLRTVRVHRERSPYILVSKGELKGLTDSMQRTCYFWL